MSPNKIDERETFGVFWKVRELSKQAMLKFQLYLISGFIQQENSMQVPTLFCEVQDSG